MEFSLFYKVLYVKETNSRTVMTWHLAARFLNS